MKNSKLASVIAFQDISKYLEENNMVNNKKGIRTESWFISPNKLNTKENRRLNKLLIKKS